MNHLPGSMLADLYVRLRDEFDYGDGNLDPNDKRRAAIAVLAAVDTLDADIVAREVRVRQVLGHE